MKTYVFCPVTDRTINEKIARLNALFILLILFGFILTQNVLFVVFLIFDFYFRATDYSKLSLIAGISKKVAKIFALNKVIINVGPKIFAARVGMVLSALIVLSFLINFKWMAMGLTAILGVFSFLESFLGLCVACMLYPYIYKYFYHKDVD